MSVDTSDYFLSDYFLDNSRERASSSCTSRQTSSRVLPGKPILSEQALLLFSAVREHACQPIAG
jgi:hypothetical protein